LIDSFAAAQYGFWGDIFKILFLDIFYIEFIYHVVLGLPARLPSVKFSFKPLVSFLP